MVRPPSIDKNGMKKGEWSEEEDQKLRSYIQKYGHWNWRQLPKFAGLARCGKSCRLRWMNYLRPDIIRGNYSKEEDDLILRLHQRFGNKWSIIAEMLPGRTDSEIKNHWHTNLKKQPRPYPTGGESSKQLDDDESSEKMKQRVETVQENQEEEMAYSGNSNEYNVAAADASSSSYLQAFADDDDPIGDFWTQPFLPDNDNTSNISATQSGFLSPHSQFPGDEFFGAYDVYWEDQINCPFSR